MEPICAKEREEEEVNSRIIGSRGVMFLYLYHRQYLSTLSTTSQNRVELRLSSFKGRERLSQSDFVVASDLGSLFLEGKSV